MKLTCKLGTSITKQVEVNPDDPLSILLVKLNISDKRTKFMYSGQTYQIYTLFTFKEIGITSDARIFINNQAISGGAYKINIKSFNTTR